MHSTISCPLSSIESVPKPKKSARSTDASFLEKVDEKVLSSPLKRNRARKVGRSLQSDDVPEEFQRSAEAASDIESSGNNSESSSTFSPESAAQEGQEIESNHNDDITEETESNRPSREAVKRAAALLDRKKPRSRANPNTEEKSTSVGARCVGSASRARQQPGSTSKLMDALRNAARGAAAANENSSDSEQGCDEESKEGPTSLSSYTREIQQNRGSENGITTQISPSNIESAIEGILQSGNIRSNGGDVAQQGRFMAAVSSLKRTVGIMGERIDSQQKMSSSECLTSSLCGTYVRLASSNDDLDIANLRLSVFSDFSMDQRGQFCARSCQAIANRRNRGAVCMVATQGEDKRPRIHGTAECSFHEFHGTQLGRRRPRSSILYVTEVAVHPSLRRKGTGALLLEAIDSFAKRRQIETVYLHVDVCNEGAMALYEKSGYRLADASEPVFEEFTKSLNLHPGATKGRSHHLLFKDVLRATWLPQDNSFTNQQNCMVGKLGFEIPA